MKELVTSASTILADRGVRGLARSCQLYLAERINAHHETLARYSRDVYRSQVLGRLFPHRYSTKWPYRLYWVDPNAITVIQRPLDHERLTADKYGRIHPVENMGKVVAGPWDTQVDSWFQLSMVKAFKQHFNDGLPWTETEFQYLFDNECEHWNERWENSRWLRLAGKREIHAELASFDDLYASIASEGYRVADPFDQVTVNVGREGQLIFNNSGSHRLCIAQLLGLERIPVRLLLRHREWNGSFSAAPKSSQLVKIVTSR